MGRISLTVPGEPQAVFAYFRDGLPGSGWALTSSSYSKLSLLTFSKGDRVATVQLQVSNFGANEVTITVTPAPIEQPPPPFFSSGASPIAMPGAEQVEQEGEGGSTEADTAQVLAGAREL